MCRITGHLVVVFWVVTTLTSQVVAFDWPHWRGSNRDGVSSQSSQWTSGAWLEPTSTWMQQVGKGTSSPLIFRGQVFVLGFSEEKDVLRCLDLATGQEKWSASRASRSHGRFALGEEYMYSGPHATPEMDPDTGLLYTLGIDGDLTCWNSNKQGSIEWSLNLYDDYGISQRPFLGKDWPSEKRLRYHRDYGYTCSPLVYGDWVIVEAGSTQHGTYIAFSKNTGKEIWRSKLKDEAGHSGGIAPILIENVPCIVGFTQRSIAVVRLDTEHVGDTLAAEPWITDGDCNIATPVVVGSSVLITSSYNQSSIARFDISLSGMNLKWKQPHASKVCTPVVHQGSVYFAWRRVHCLDFESGELKWVGGAYGEPGSCVATSDGRVIVCGGKGKVGLIEGAEKSPDQFKELSVGEPMFEVEAWPHVAFVDGHLVCRDRSGSLTCFSVRKE